MFDSSSRNIHYLRLSVTDLCNLRCRYCMPDGVEKLEREAVLTYEEFLRLAALFAQCGVDTVRVTGGEPLVRKGVDQLVAGLKAIPGIHKVTLTTNGILLAPVMEYNKDYTGEKYRDIADAFGIADAYTGDIETVREEAVQAVHKLTVDLKNPTKISEVGATEADLEPLAHDAFHDVCTPGNPRQATQEDILAIYKSLM